MCGCGFFNVASQETSSAQCSNCPGDDYTQCNDPNCIRKNQYGIENLSLINPSLYMNVAFSNKQIAEQKKNLVLNGIESIKHIAYLDLSDETIYLDIRTMEEQIDKCKKLLKKFKSSQLSNKEKNNLYANIQSQFLSHNTLNLYLGVNVVIKKQGITQATSEIIENTISKRLKTAIDTILLNATFSDECNNYNYTEAYNFLYYFVSLNLHLLRNKILAKSSAAIFRMYYFDGQVNNNGYPDL